MVIEFASLPLSYFGLGSLQEGGGPNKKKRESGNMKITGESFKA